MCVCEIHKFIMRYVTNQQSKNERKERKKTIIKFTHSLPQETYHSYFYLILITTAKNNTADIESGTKNGIFKRNEKKNT